jgi:hypothetical protein
LNEADPRFRGNVAASRRGAAALLLGFAAACGPEQPAIPDVEPLAALAPDVRLGMSVAELEAARPGADLWPDGSHRESLPLRQGRAYDIIYHFSPRGENVPPPRTARLAAVEGRTAMRDSLSLRQAWVREVETVARHLDVSPRCVVLGGDRATTTRAEFGNVVAGEPERPLTPGLPVVSISAEIVRAPDGRDHTAMLATRAGVSTHEHPGERGLSTRQAACDTLGAARSERRGPTSFRSSGLTRRGRPAGRFRV